MNVKGIIQSKHFRPLSGAVLAAVVGLLLWKVPFGEPWVNASYDYLFRFGSQSVSNRIVLVRMDNGAFDYFQQSRETPWDRELHANLLNRLADDGCAMVVFDAAFKQPGNPRKDDLLADAMRRAPKVVLMAELARAIDEKADQPSAHAAQPVLPSPYFLQAARTNWGVAWLDQDLDYIVRRHWPFPSPAAAFPSLPETVVRLSGGHIDEEPRQRWIRYYRDGAWVSMSYHFVSNQVPNYFRDKIVFVGNRPENTIPGNEVDEFSTPSTRWTGESAGGVEIMITETLNLMHRHWLERPAAWIELAIIAFTGFGLGGLLGRLRPLTALLVAFATAALAGLIGVSWIHFNNTWFPWLIISGGQVPVALAWAVLMPTIRRVQETITVTGHASPPVVATETPPRPGPAQFLPDTPDYELINPPFGEGAYGKVWLARNAIGQWQALKVVYLKNFDNNPDPFDREFNGISRYKPVSDKHPGLLRVDFVSRKRDGYFYYVMELGDGIEPDWEKDPGGYKPRDLVHERSRAPGKRLPVRDCIRIGLSLADALEFLHGQGLTHRDIKPQNIIFVGGQPKLADVGLTADIRPADKERTFVGTPGYMPPHPERPGTAQADVYSLGMVLYVLSTGRSAGLFPEVATTLINSPEPGDFLPLNQVVLKACQPDLKQRYASARELHDALLEVSTRLGNSETRTADASPA